MLTKNKLNKFVTIAKSILERECERDVDKFDGLWIVYSGESIIGKVTFMISTDECPVYTIYGRFEDAAAAQKLFSTGPSGKYNLHIGDTKGVENTFEVVIEQYLNGVFA